MQPRIIVIDGRTYQKAEEMPPEVRQKYEQAMKSLGDSSTNSIPDAFERSPGFASQNRSGTPEILDDVVAGQDPVKGMKIIVDGKEYQGMENLPPEIRARYDDAIRQLDANGNSIPDFVEGILRANAAGTKIASEWDGEFPRRPTSSHSATASAIRGQRPITVSPTVTPDTTNGWMLVLTGLLIFLMCVAGVAGVWYFFLR